MRDNPRVTTCGRWRWKVESKVVVIICGGGGGGVRCCREAHGSTKLNETKRNIQQNHELCDLFCFLFPHSPTKEEFNFLALLILLVME